MKKTIYAALATLLTLTSCENDVEILWRDTNNPVLVLCAQLKQDETRHRVQIYCSEGAGCNYLEDARLSYSVNGSAPLTIEYGDYGYVFDADLKPGDKIALQASWRDLRASAEAIVPQSAAEITAVETKREMDNSTPDYVGKQPVTKYAISVRDQADQKDYYMLAAYQLARKLDADGNTLASIRGPIHLDGSKDKLLNPIGDQASEFLSISNYFNLFSDEMFAGGTCTLNVEQGYAIRYNDWNDFFANLEDGDLYAIDTVIQVYSISFDEFMYVKAQDGDGIDLEFMTEPVIYPENVSGGLGFVTVMTPASWTIPGEVLSWEATLYTGE